MQKSKLSRTPRTKTKLETFQKLVDRANDAFGGFNSACIRTGHHVSASALTGTEKDLDTVYAGNVKSVFFALHAIVPPLVAQGSGQVVINTSAGATRPQPAVALYCATRQAANGLVRATGLEVAAKGVTVNATGTAGMEYPSYLHMMGADKSEEARQADMNNFPMKRYVQPEDAASFVATLIDGTATGHDRPVLLDRCWLQHCVKLRCRTAQQIGQRSKEETP